jgi:cysteine desulfurase
MNPADGGEQLSGYFDWAATAPPDRDLALESAELSLSVFGNPSSLHSAGKRARDKLEEARARLARVMGIPADTLYFTSGGTEANHLPLLALLRRPRPAAVSVSAIEHSSVREMAESLKAAGWRVDVVRSDSRGVVTPDAVLNAVAGDTALVCVMAANNETGAIQPVSGIADALRKACRFLHRSHSYQVFVLLYSSPRYLCNQAKHQKQRLILDIISSIRYR